MALHKPRRLAWQTRRRASAIKSVVALWGILAFGAVLSAGLYLGWDSLPESWWRVEPVKVVYAVSAVMFGVVALRGAYIFALTLGVISPIYSTRSGVIGSLPTLMLRRGLRVVPGELGVAELTEPQYQPGPFGRFMWLWSLKSGDTTIHVLSGYPLEDLNVKSLESGLEPIGVKVVRMRRPSIVFRWFFAQRIERDRS